MSTNSTIVVDEVVEFIQSVWIGNCSQMAASCLVFYDFVTTLDREIELLWGRKLNSVTILFYLNRWITLLWAIWSLLEVNFGSLDSESLLLQQLTSCIGLDEFGNVLPLVLLILWAVFSAVRVYALSTGSWILSCVVLLLGMVPVGTNTYLYYGVARYSVQEILVLGSWCVQTLNIDVATSTKLAISTRVCTIAADVIILLITWYKTYATKREADRLKIKTPIATMLLRDGTAYFVLLLCLSVVNIVGWATDVFIDVGTFITPLSSIIISHFLLNLRQAVHKPLDATLDLNNPSFLQSQLGSLRFASLVDNLGEQLDHGLGSSIPNTEWETDEDDIEVNDQALPNAHKDHSSLNDSKQLHPAVNFKLGRSSYPPF